ncbi:TIGR01777 family oxidoreductase [Flavobacteriaceae sp. LMIT009]
MSRVLITGATGLVGQEIVKQCHAKNITVNYLTTNKNKIVSLYNYQGFYWNPKTGDIDDNCFKDVDTIINLSGATVAKRWSKRYKAEILNSRLDSLRLLFNAVKANNYSIKQLISASAIGIYPDSRTNYYDETNKVIGNSFLAQVTKQWEAEAQKFEELNIKVALVRIGIVLASNGGALPKMIKPIKAFIGSPLGGGGQWQSWIHIEDLANIFMFINKNKLEGLFNGVAPNPVKQRELVKAIAKVVNRPLFLPRVPSFILKLLLGEMSALVLESQRVSSKKLEDIGFNYRYNYLLPTLENLL